MGIGKIAVMEYLEGFKGHNSASATAPGESNETKKMYMKLGRLKIPCYINEFWTARQRQASSIHEISYRACFKAQLPHFFIDLLTSSGNLVYDPFSGRGTTVIEAALMERRIASNDINPLSHLMTAPRLEVPPVEMIRKRLDSIPQKREAKAAIDLTMFYHPATEAEIVSLQSYLEEKRKAGEDDYIDRWLGMVATSRLTGHSPGFFSVYTLPPNQAVSAHSQNKINLKRNQKPVYRDTQELIIRKTKSLIRSLSLTDIKNLKRASSQAISLACDASETAAISSSSVNLTVTSPPFLDVVQYSKDNWLRCWFNGIDAREVEDKITMAKTIEQWTMVMGMVFKELYRITAEGGWVAFEVGEVRQGKIRLEEHIIPPGIAAGFNCVAVLINSQRFTKTANIWGVKNNCGGTNTNRIVLLHKSSDLFA